MAVALQPGDQRAELLAGPIRRGRSVRLAHRGENVAVAFLGQMLPKIPLLMDLATLDHGSVSEDIVQRLSDPLPAVDDAQDLVLDPQAATHKTLEQARAQHRVLRR